MGAKTRCLSGLIAVAQAEASMARLHGTHMVLRPCERHENGTLDDAEYEAVAEAALRELATWPTGSRLHWLEAGAASHWAPPGAQRQDAATEARRAAILLRLAADSRRFEAEAEGAYAHGLRVLVSQEAAGLLLGADGALDGHAWVLTEGAVAKSEAAVPSSCGVPGSSAVVDLPFARRAADPEGGGAGGAALVEVGGGAAAGHMARAQAASYDESLATGLLVYTAAAAYSKSRRDLDDCLQVTDQLDGVTLEYFSGDVQAYPNKVRAALGEGGRFRGGGRLTRGGGASGVRLAGATCR